MKAILCMLAVLAAIASGCGSDDDDGKQAPPAGPVVGEGLPPEVRHPVTRTIDRLQRAFADEDYEGFCAWVTPSAARFAGEAAHGDATTCERDVRRLFNLIRKGGGWRHVGAPRVVDVKVDGPTATATVALDRRWQAPIALARSDGRWRLNGLFGAAPKQAVRTALATEDTDFPPADDPVEVSDGYGFRCPRLTGDYPRLDGGCRLELSGRTAPIDIVTPFGDFQFSKCWIAYDVRVDATGRTWTEEFEVEGGPENEGCADVGSCYDETRGVGVPWRGRIYKDGDDLIHRMDACIGTCVGYFVGRLTVRLERDGDRWRAEPVNGGGKTGLRFVSPLAVKGRLDVAAATS